MFFFFSSLIFLLLDYNFQSWGSDPLLQCQWTEVLPYSDIQQVVQTTCIGLESESVVAPLCLTLCDPMDCKTPGSSVYGILQARTLESVAIPFSRRSPQPKY